MAQVNGVRRQFVKAAMAAPFLERGEEHALAVRWKDQRDEDALHQVASAHMRLVIALAARFRHYGLPMADLIQEGHLGLLEAAARFEPEREVRFSTYATWWIRASIQDYILRKWYIVSGGTSTAPKALFFNLRARLGPEAPFLQSATPARPPDARWRGADRVRGARQDRRGDRRVARRRGPDGCPPVGSGYLPERPGAGRGFLKFGGAGRIPGRYEPVAGRERHRRDRHRAPGA